MGHIKNKILKAIFMCGGIVALTACQNNPEEDFVVSKEKTILDKAAESVDTQVDSEKIDHEESRVFNDEFYGIDENVTIKVDFTMENHNKDISIYRSMMKNIEMDEIKAWANVLFEDAEVYEPISKKTKGQIEEQILTLKQRISNRELLLTEYENDESAVNSYIEYVEQLIVSLESAYPDAPDDIERKATDWTFHNYSYYDTEAALMENDASYQLLNKSNVFEATADINGRPALISAMNRTEEDYNIHNICFYYLDEEEMRNAPVKETLSEAEADEIAADMAKQLGFDDWVIYDKQMSKSDLSDASNEYEYFSYIYTPTYNNISSFYMPLMHIKNEDAYAANYYYENLEIIIESGAISYICWNSPLNIIGEEVKDVKILSDDDIYEKFKNQMQMTYSLSTFKDIYMEGVKTCRLEVNDAAFRMMRVKEKNSSEFLIVPVWQFIGDIYLDERKIGTEQTLAVLNAFDGSSINAELGY